MNQMSAKADIKKHDKAAVNTIFKEYSQLDDINVFGAKYNNELTSKHKQDALWLITMIKEKKNRWTQK